MRVGSLYQARAVFYVYFEYELWRLLAHIDALAENVEFNGARKA